MHTKNPQPQPKLEINPKKQPEEMVVHTEQTTTTKKKTKTPKKALFILLYSLLAYFAVWERND